MRELSRASTSEPSSSGGATVSNTDTSQAQVNSISMCWEDCPSSWQPVR